ncbi:MAG: hypothetical protein LBQ87_10355, partial [Candidatus Fibromonas sp.]|nr:hypothetical protein [Candidatus Fibromonas sp.]
MKAKIPFLFLLLLSCQGPWSYYPDDSENYRGIWVNAFIVSGRPVEEVCFDKMHALDEVHMPGFAFYESAEVQIKGTFRKKNYYDINYYQSLLPPFDPSGPPPDFYGDTSFFLIPNINRSPNCFYGPWDLTPEAGRNYELNASITWDSAGTRVTSRLRAKTYIPENFKILRAYDLEGQQYNSDDRISYLPPPMDIKANYFIPKYSEDAAGVLVSMVFDEDVYWGENTMTRLASPFVGESTDTTAGSASLLAKFGDREGLYFARNMKMMNSQNEMDSIPVLGFMMPANGRFKLLFYATPKDYVKYRDSYLNGAEDSRIEAVYNVEGGAGIFTGMLVDTFWVNIWASPDVKTYSYSFAQEDYCYGMNLKFLVEQWRIDKRCIKIWEFEVIGNRSY